MVGVVVATADVPEYVIARCIPVESDGVDVELLPELFLPLPLQTRRNQQ